MKHRAEWGHSLKSGILHMSYFCSTSPFIVESTSVNMVCSGAPRQWRHTETSFSPQTSQAWRYDAAGTVGVQQKTVAGSHGWQGAGEHLCRFIFEICISCWLRFGHRTFLMLTLIREITVPWSNDLSLAPSSGDQEVSFYQKENQGDLKTKSVFEGKHIPSHVSGRISKIGSSYGLKKRKNLEGGNYSCFGQTLFKNNNNNK